MNRKIIAAGLAGLAVVAVTALMVGRPVERLAPPPGPVALVESTNPTDGGAALSPVIAAAAPDRGPEIVFKRLDVETAGSQPEACLVFSGPLAVDGVRYEDYVRIRPAIQAAIAIRGGRLCLSGLAFGRDHEIDLLPGLPGEKGAALRQGERVPVSLGDRPPLIAFMGGSILPRGSSAGVPLSTVNVDQVQIEVYRVGERGWHAIREEYLREERRTYGYRLDDMAERRGILVWAGTLDIKNLRNQQVVTSFPLARTVEPRKPGVYWIVAWNQADGGRPDSNSDDRWRRSFIAQWVIDSDIGLTTYQGADGLHVFARSFDTAKPMRGITVTLIARGNDELGRVVADRDGHVQFPAGLLRGTGAAAPAAVMAFGGDEDFALLDLSRPGFDLSDRGVSGRTAPGPIDGYVWTERGIYRPGETVELMALLRDQAVRALPDTATTLVVTRPDGIEYRRFVARSDNGGAVARSIALTASAPRGLWSAALHVDPTGAPVGRAQFQVQDFVPQRLKVTLAPEKPTYGPGEPIKIAVEARFLYGAPAVGLDGEAEATIEPDPEPFPHHAGFRFGLDEERPRPATRPFAVAITDDSGKTAATATLDDLAETSWPLRAMVRVSVFEPGGRSTDDTAMVKLRRRPSAIGIRPLFRDNRTPWNSSPRFEAIVVDRNGGRIAGTGLSYELIREEYDWHWYRTQGDWRHEAVTRDRRIAEGRLDIAADAPAVIQVPVTYGMYRLVVREAGRGAASSVRFNAGWQTSVAADRAPDRLDIGADRSSYAPGTKARIRIETPYAGEALIVLANDRVLDTRQLSIAAGGVTVELPVTADWGPGAYAMVTLVRPLSDTARSRAPVRAIGVAWLGVDTKDRQLEVKIAVPESVRPREKLDISLQLRGATRPGRAYVTVAAVDEGILQLTRYATPDPVAHYFGKRRLGLQLRDDYGRLIDGANAVAGAIRSGGDAGFGGRGLEVVPTRTVALFSGPVQVDSAGRAELRLDIPDFIGELRLMAVAYDDTRVGGGEARLHVRDALVSDATLPRFLAPGDRSRLSLLLHNLEGSAGEYRMAWTAEGPIKIGGEASRTLALATGARQFLAWPLEATDIGIGRLVLRLTGPDGFDVTRDWSIQVRPAQAPVNLVHVARLAPGGEMAIDRDLAGNFVRGSEAVSVSLASWRGFDAAGLIRSLDRYPFGCLEQTTSRAFPLLYFNDVALLGRMPGDKAIETRVQDAVWRVLDMQQADGGFGMWSARGGGASGWLSVYAIDFLAQAKAKGKIVPDDALRRAYAYLRDLAGDVPLSDVDYVSYRPSIGERPPIPYALYVLAREGQVDIGRMRYLHDRLRGGNSFSLGQLGAALALAGDRSRAANAFQLAQAHIGQSFPADYYGSPLRDLAGLLTVAAIANQPAVVQSLFDRFDRLDKLPSPDEATTQEKAWMLLATEALSRGRAPLRIERNGETIRNDRDRVVFNPDSAALAGGLTFRNAGDADIWATVSASGVPVGTMPAVAEGVTVKREFLTLDGQPAQLEALRQNDRLIVSISGRVADRLRHELAVLDLLPAGFEIESPISSDGEGRSRFAFLAPLSETDVLEARDDRFVAAVTRGQRDNYRYREPELRIPGDMFHVAYVVRAITPGTYTLPAVSVEDMYRPTVQARSMPGTVVIAPRE